MICGRFSKDPEIKFLPSGKAVCNFSLIVNDDNGGSDLIPCVAWEKKARNIADNMRKGSLMLCEVKIKSTTFHDTENNKQFQLQCELLPFGKLLFLDQKKVDDEGLEGLPDKGGEHDGK